MGKQSGAGLMKQKAKIAIDFLMTVLLLLLMSYMLIGETVHEWIGTAMVVLFILHHALNWQWYKNLIKGKYSLVRTLQTIVDFLVLFAIIGSMVSGIILSRKVFAFLPIEGGMASARILHMLAAYWGFILMSVHLGMHWGMIIGTVRKACGITGEAFVRTWILRVFALLICSFGIFSFIRNHIADYLFMHSQFVFFDMEKPLILFLGEYLAIMGLWACLAYYISGLLRKYRR